MTYAKIENGKVEEFPVYEGEIRLRYPNVSFPTPFIAPEGYEPVIDVIPPAYDYRQNLSEGVPALIEGKWMRQWILSSANEAEIAERTEAQWSAVRSERNAQLAASDWIVTRSAEAGVPVPSGWKDYRQALRDVTSQPDPFAIVWPTPPA